ncbi:ATP synthase F1 subunit gamma [Gemmatimonas aurantiaca]|nr:ATP synthase F1 subunit gamma [Gemmatimonas aurantiaca]
MKSTHQITKAMEMVAAAKLRRAQQRALEARPYADQMSAMLSSLAEGSTGDISHPFFELREVKRRTLVVVVSDRGLCGSYNSNLLRAADKWLAKQDAGTVDLVCVGKRALDYYGKTDYPIIASYLDWSGAMDYARAKQIVAFLTRRFLDGETDQVNVVFAKFLSTSRSDVTNEVYLPVDPPKSGADTDSASRKEYIFEPNPEDIYASLMPSYALTKMVTALLDSFASEHGARMVAMSNATKNAKEMIDNLTLTYNKARQGQITKELLEIVGGAEALKN